jgi:diphthamide synthase subunit DPH2
MARGNPDNFTALSTDEARKRGKQGGIASGKSRRERKTLAEELKVLLSSGKEQKKVCLALVESAKDGNVRAFEIIRDTIGEKPVDKMESEATAEITFILPDEIKKYAE